MICPFKLTKKVPRDIFGIEIDIRRLDLQCENDCAWLIKHTYETPVCALKALTFTFNEVFEVSIEKEIGDKLL